LIPTSALPGGWHRHRSLLQKAQNEFVDHQGISGPRSCGSGAKALDIVRLIERQSEGK